MQVREFSVSLRVRVFNEDIHPTEICEQLGLEPQVKWILGQPRKTPKGNLLSGIYEQSYCCFNLKREDGEQLSSMLSRACDDLLAHKDLFHRIRAVGGEVEFFIGWMSHGNSGEIFDHHLLAKLGALGVDLGMDVYNDASPVSSMKLEII